MIACAVYSVAFDSGYSALTISPLMCGTPNPLYDAPVPNPPVANSPNDLAPNKNNKCVLTGIASPANLGYVEGHNALLIGTLVIALVKLDLKSCICGNYYGVRCSIAELIILACNLKV